MGNELMEAYKVTFNNPVGQKVLRHLKKWVDLNRIDRKSPDPNHALYLMGQLDLLKEIDRKINTEPDIKQE